MKARWLYLFVWVFFIMGLLQEQVYSQNNSNQPVDNQVAMQYYRNGEYEKAVEIFHRLYLTNHSDMYYRYYLNCLLQLQKYNDAEDLINKQLKASRKEPRYLVDLGYLYSIQKNEPKAESTYQQAINRLDGDVSAIIQTANAFLERRLFNYAQQTYLKGRKLLKDEYGFQMELGQVYYMERNYEKMIGEYLDLLAISDMYLQSIQNQLQNAVYNDVDNSLKEMLKDQLLQRVQARPDVVVYSELLIWLFIQDKNFEAAFIQAKALDLRQDENGQRIISLARIATDNNDFQTAVEAYQYVINKGRNLEYFFAARNELLKVMYRRVELGFDNRMEDYLRLEGVLTDALQEMGSNAETVDIYKNLAHLKAFYLNKTAEAVFLLESAAEIRGIDNPTRGSIENELADVYLMQGNIWDATLTYARVADENANNPVGSEAKFRKARLGYYIGNFKWAQAQLDVLKGSTEKLPANDAAALSLLIMDNTEWDSTENALRTYARADLLHYQHKDSLALLALDTLIAQYATHPLVDEAWYLKASILKSNGKLPQAIVAWQYIADHFGYDVLADNALYNLARAYQYDLHDNDKAMQYYLKIITDHGDSIFVIEARKQYRNLRGDKLIN
jgi:tetratricopeptide (TPR) repeat protein